MINATDLNDPSRTISVEKNGELVSLAIVGASTFTLVNLKRADWEALVAGAA